MTATETVPECLKDDFYHALDETGRLNYEIGWQRGVIWRLQRDLEEAKQEIDGLRRELRSR